MTSRRVPIEGKGRQMNTDARSPSSIDPARLVRVTVEGVAREAIAGESVASLLAGEAGESGEGQRHDLFCGMGVCHECLVTIDGRLGERACMTKVRDGMRIERQASRPQLASDDLVKLSAAPRALSQLTMDVLVIGAGPAGLAAAEAAAEAGAKVTIVDERALAGGQFFKQPATSAARSIYAKDAQAQAGAALVDRVRNLGVSLLTDVLVWGGDVGEGGALRIACLGPEGVFYCAPRYLVIATGAYERPRPFPGWTLPGVMTAGAAQTFLRAYGRLPGKRVLIAGNGPLNLQVAKEIIGAGGTVVALAEEAKAPWHRPIPSTKLALANPAVAIRGLWQVGGLVTARVPLLWRSALVSVEGSERAERAMVHTPAGPRWFDVEAVLIGGGFVSSNELPRLLGCSHEEVAGGFIVKCGPGGATSVPGVHVVGEAARFAGATVALAEGRRAGLAVAASLGHSVVADRRIERQLKQAKAFQKALWATFAPAADTKETFSDETIVCRCEKVDHGRIAALIRKGVRNVPALKRMTRAGMGRCQGRYCAATLAAMIAKHGQADEAGSVVAPQMPLKPVPLAALAVEKPEWAGHQRVLLPEKPVPANTTPLPISDIDTLVIGAGIAGLSTALYLARAGMPVAVVERGYANGLASGGNAGSLHAQLLSFDHGARAEAGGGPAARTLPLQLRSIALWRELAGELAVDFEMKTTGGLMVAESDAHLRFLEEKTAVERSVGVECHVIGRDELRAREPALSEIFVGAAYCPEEGKINPLLATPAVLDAAVAAGAQLFERTEVLAIERQDRGFKVTTSRGVIKAGRIVNAAGAFAGRIGAMAGVEVPVFGAPLQMVVTEPVAPLVSHLVAHADRHLTLKQAANGNFIIGGGWTAGLDPVHQHPRPSLESLEGNLWVALHVVPALAKLRVIRSWAAMNINIDGAPILGEHPDCPGLFNAVTSNGYTLGPLVGQTTASLVLGKSSDFDLSPFSITRFARNRS